MLAEAALTFARNFGLGAAEKPPESPAFVARLAGEIRVGEDLGWFAGVNKCGFKALLGQPLEERSADEFEAVIRQKLAGGALRGDQAAEANRGGSVDRQALSRELVEHRQPFELYAVGASVEQEVVSPELVRAEGEEWSWT